MRLIAAAVAALLVVGCATEPVPTSMATAATRVLDPSITRPAEGTVAVTIKRDTGFNTGGCSFRVYIDGRPAADLNTGEKITVYLTPGEHLVGAQANGICLGTGLAEAALTVQPGQSKAYRIGVDAMGTMRVQPTAF